MRAQVPEEVGKKLGQANLLYATGQYKEAAELLMDVIKVCPGPCKCDVCHTCALHGLKPILMQALACANLAN